MANTALPKRRPNGTIMPGHSLNPSGRPRVVQEIQELARSAAPAAFAKIVGLLDSADERTALAASQEVLNRAYGKPMQQVQSEVRQINMGSLLALAMKEKNKGEAALPIIDMQAEPVQSANEVQVQQEPGAENDATDPVEW
jgi:hypothetical protein